MQCPHCHAEDQTGHFCVKCGQRISEEPEEPASDDSSNISPKDDIYTMGDEDSITETENPLDILTEDPLMLDTPSRKKKIISIAGFILGIALAVVVGLFLFQHFFGIQPVGNNDGSSTVEQADIVSPEDGVVADSIVGHWRHYNTGIVIDKIGTDHYRWKSGKKVYELRFKDNQYVLKDESNSYYFFLEGPDRLKLQHSADADGGLVKKPLFATGYVAGRIGQDGTPAKNLYVNKDAFDIVGRTYGELAGMYGPGAISVINDDQYIVFRGPGGNFAVQFSGNTVPLAENNQDYKIVKLTAGNTTPTENDSTGSNNSTTTPPPTTPPANSTPPTNNNNSTTTNNESTSEKEEKKDYKLEIPDMPTFPSNSAIATGVVWADLGFVIANAPQTMTVENLSAILKISLEVGDAPSNASGYTFYGMDEGYFAGVYTLGNHQFRLTGYGNKSLNKDKTTIFIEQLS